MKFKNNIINANNNISMISIDCGNSYITYYMLKSLIPLCKNRFEIIILCLKDNRYLDLLYEFRNNVKLVYLFNDSTVERHLANLEYSACHSYAIKYAVDNYIKTDYFLLCDNDIIFSNLSMLKTNYEDYDVVGQYDLNNLPMIGNLLYIMQFKKWIKYSDVPTEINKLPDVNINYEHKKFNIYTFKNLKVFVRLLPFYIILNKKTFNKYFSTYVCPAELHRNNYYYIDTFSMFTYRLLKNNCKILDYNIANDIEHIGGSTNKYSMELYKAKILTIKNNLI